MRIACLHTAASNAAVFDAACPAGVTLSHAVRSDLLAAAEVAGGLTTEIALETAAALRRLEGDRVLLTCSTIGAAAGNEPGGCFSLRGIAVPYAKRERDHVSLATFPRRCLVPARRARHPQTGAAPTSFRRSTSRPMGLPSAPRLFPAARVWRASGATGRANPTRRCRRRVAARPSGRTARPTVQRREQAARCGRHRVTKRAPG